MNELSLFTGAGGGVLGSKLLGWRTIGYVERDPYCQAVLQARIEDGVFDRAPIFGDIRKFLRDGWADRYRGLVDVVTAGFPCQPFSLAGKQRAHDDDRNMWPETAEVLARVRPACALLENVPGLLSGSHNYFEKVLSDLAEMGFDAEWGVLGADDAGAPHRRKRLWILAYSNRWGFDRGWLEEHAGIEGSSWGEPDGCSEGGWGDRQGRCIQEGEASLSDPECNVVRIESGRGSGQGGPCETEPRDHGEDSVGHAVDEGLEGHAGNGNDRSESGRIGEEENRSAGASGLQWWDKDPAEEGAQSESRVDRVAVGLAHRVDRLRAIGNGQVPAVVVKAWEELNRQMGKGVRDVR